MNLSVRKLDSIRGLFEEEMEGVLQQDLKSVKAETVGTYNELLIDFPVILRQMGIPIILVAEILLNKNMYSLLKQIFSSTEVVQKLVLFSERQTH